MIDLSLNPCDTDYELTQNHQETVLSGDYGLIKNPVPGFEFFPSFLWVFSRRDPAWYTHVKNIVYDCDVEKSQPMCCFNRMPSWHRVYFYTLLVNRPWFDRVFYTFGNHTKDNDYEIADLTKEELERFNQAKHLLPLGLLPSDTSQVNDVGIGHPAYSQCAFNLVTETSVDIKFVSEKSCKPFMAYQIPIIVGPIGINAFLESLGLDMFSDVVKWQEWDNIQDARTRMDTCVRFLDSLFKKDLVQMHQVLKARVEQNKHYFHSAEFQQRLSNFKKV